MGTGISSILLHELPYQFPGLRIIANVIFGYNAILFVLFCALSILRYSIWPRTLPGMLFHPVHSLFLGTFSMGLTTMVNLCAVEAAPYWGSKFATFTWVVWWINVVISVFVCIGVPFIQFTRHIHTPEKMTAQWLLPVVSTVVMSACSATVSEIIPQHYAHINLIVGYVLLGTGLPLAFMVMAIYYGRLAIFKIPPAGFIVSAFLPLGPCGQGAFALMKLSSEMRTLAESGTWLGLDLGIEQARIFAAAVFAPSLVLALAIWGLGFVWLVLAIISMIDLALVQRLEFDIGWWGMTFPLGVFSTAATQFAIELDSGFFRVLGTVLSCSEVAVCIAVSIKTVMRSIDGSLFLSLDEPTPVSTRKYGYTPRWGQSASGASDASGASASIAGPATDSSSKCDSCN